MLNKISFKNYKVFKEKQVLEIRPITILIGKNNTGKSAILKLMTVIEGALNSSDNKAISLINDGVQVGTEFKDLIYGKFGRALEIELFQNNEEGEISDTLAFNISVDVNRNIPILEYWKLNTDLEFSYIDKSIYENEIDNNEYFCDFTGVYLNYYFEKDKPDVSGTIYKQLFGLFTDFIGAIREKTKLDYRLASVTNSKSNIDGSLLYDFLIKDYLTTEKKYFLQISEWLKLKFEGWELHIDVDSEPYHIELRKDKLAINITDTGMGIGQSLPLIIRAFRPCDKQTLVIVEEPECHLHPFAHAEIAELFAKSLKLDSNKKYLIETHSQNFILRLRRLVALGVLNKEDIGIYYVDFDELKNESSLSEIKVDDGGGVEWWPEGIFGETSRETRAIYNAQLNELKNVDRD